MNLVLEPFDYEFFPRALFAAIGSWAMVGLVALVYAPTSMAMLAIVPTPFWNLARILPGW